MYTKEQIIEEIKRVVQSRGGKLPSETDFEQQSTIPVSTLRFHLGSWQRALEEAGIIPKLNGKITRKEEPKSDDDLLLDLVRLFEDSGELPTPASIQAKGKYSERHYRDRWRSIGEAFQIAKKKFGGKGKSSPLSETPPPIPRKDIPPLGRSIPLEKKTDEEIKAKYVLDEPLEPLETLNPLDLLEPVTPSTSPTPVEPMEAVRPEVFIPPPEPEFPKAPKVPEAPEAPKVPNLPNVPNVPEEPAAEPTELIGAAEMDNNNTFNTPKIRFIPQTIKPQQAAKPRVPLEPIDFRGLRFAPATKQGVAFLFGMVSGELGFIIESFASDSPDCEGKRCVDSEGNQWERLKIQLEYKSSDFKTRSGAAGFDARHCDLIVCWSHDWPECPFEVLELQSILKHLT